MSCKAAEFAFKNYNNNLCIITTENFMKKTVTHCCGNFPQKSLDKSRWYRLRLPFPRPHPHVQLAKPFQPLTMFTHMFKGLLQNPEMRFMFWFFLTWSLQNSSALPLKPDSAPEPTVLSEGQVKPNKLLPERGCGLPPSRRPVEKQHPAALRWHFPFPLSPSLNWEELIWQTKRKAVACTG